MSARVNESRLRARLPRIVGPLVIALAWEALTRTEVLDPRFFVPVTTILRTMGEMAASGVLASEVAVTLQRLGLGFAGAAIGGVVLGVATGVSRTINLLFRPIIDTIYPIPKVALLPLLIIMVGIGEPAFVLTAFMTAIFQIVISVAAGVRDVDPLLIEAGRTYGATGWRFYWRVLIPGMLPSLLHGLRIGMGMCLITVIAVEFVAANSGVGNIVHLSWQQMQVPEMYVGLVVAGLLGHLISLLFSLIERVALPWRQSRSAVMSAQTGG
ncbi:ABC transporter permease [Spiractinospora alimapuensis]|uniref:ABC transporter permease n=1 Tax=Spiractinospora alimapuensis TaxID=2820884 RepID=UPI001F1D008C|nr:ABC transporter permease [Spiractinospora alimapuensis]QVQ53899.1 ABC transporter permease [Spiractinospora alimapuensis]